MEYETLEISVPKLWKKMLIPDAGHWLQQEKPEDTSRLLIEFLQQSEVTSQLYWKRGRNRPRSRRGFWHRNWRAMALATQYGTLPDCVQGHG
ncbi:alpha/beta fold hydrolase [Cupriavidus basilensis]